MKAITDLDAWRAQALEALQESPDFQFQLRPGGEVFTVPHPLMMTDERRGELDRSVGSLAIATSLIGGDEVYGRFAAAGGRFGDIMLAWKVMQQGLSMDPTLSAFGDLSSAAPQPSSPISNTAIPVSAAPSTNGGAPSWQAPAN